MSLTESQRQRIVTLRPDQHGFITGATGSGKTYLAHVLLRNAPYAVIIDIKGMFRPEREYDLVTRPEGLHRAKKPWILYRPDPDSLRREHWERVFEWIYRRRNTRVYNDELASMGQNWTDFPRWLQVCYLQGRELRVGMLSSSQRPANIPGYAISECDKLWKFFLLKKTDQERMATMMGPTVLEDKAFPSVRRHHHEHSFYYWDDKMRGYAEEFVLRKMPAPRAAGRKAA